MDRLSTASNAYIKSLNKRDCGEGKEKTTAIAHFGSTLTAHGDDFEQDSEFGQCLVGLGRANERIARLQETFTANATGSWLESVERSQIQMKELQAARKKLDNRRLAHDTASAKVQRAKKEDFRVEEEARSQRAKYEESYEEVVRRMLDVKEAEGESVADLTTFLDAQCAYYDRCREILGQLRKEWPATGAPANGNGGGSSGFGGGRSDTASPVPSLGGGGSTISRRNTGTISRSRGSSINTHTSNNTNDDAFGAPLRPTISGRLPSGQNSPHRELPGFNLPTRPAIPGRSNSGFEGPVGREQPPALTRVPTEPSRIQDAKASLRATGKVNRPDSGVYDHGSNGSLFSDDASEISDGPVTNGWQNPSMLGHDGSGVAVNGGKRAPPPPP